MTAAETAEGVAAAHVSTDGYWGKKTLMSLESLTGLSVSAMAVEA